MPDALSGSHQIGKTTKSEQDIGSEEVPRQESTHGFIPTWNAKCPIFEGNFTPKTSNYCIKNRALGFPGNYITGCKLRIHDIMVCQPNPPQRTSLRKNGLIRPCYAKAMV